MDVNFPEKWDENYQRGTDGWDLGRSTPLFQQLLLRQDLPPGRIIVLGAGRGHDAREFARYGFQVTAVDFSSRAVQEMHRLASPDAPVEILQHDIFMLPESFNQSFDYVLEYTCFCAIDPTRRAAYADLVARLLKLGGMYIDLAFPLDGRKGGPPFAVTIKEILDLFQARDFKLISREKSVQSIPRRRDAEELLLFQKMAREANQNR